MQPEDWHNATAHACRDILAAVWLASHTEYYRSDEKLVFYLSMEFLIGRSLSANLVNLGLYEVCREAYGLLGLDWKPVVFTEPEAGLGNGGLGRLAACLIDSLATVGIAGWGYGIRYDYGMFRQRLDNGVQVEEPDDWARHGTPVGVPPREEPVEVQFGGRVMHFRDAEGRERHEWVDGERVLAVGRDQADPRLPVADGEHPPPVAAEVAPSNSTCAASTPATTSTPCAATSNSQNLSRILYPDDSTHSGKELRFKQEYFFVCASLQDILRRYLQDNPDFGTLPDKVAIQLNDTHPAMAIPELMRLLMDDPRPAAGTRRGRSASAIFSYTNHTVMPEALETWPVEMFERLLPRHYEIICEINRRFLEHVQHRFPGDFEL